MKILKIEIHNYRNLDGVKVFFSDDCNFIVGENNLGKTNLLSLLDVLFTRRSFENKDFQDTTKPLEIILQLKLDPMEIGHFQDLFDVQDYSIINILCRQLNTDEYIEFTHLESNTYITPSLIRSINYIYYDSLRNPVTEINFDKGRGVGRFLSSLIGQYLKDNNITDMDFLEPARIDGLTKAVNDKLSKIKSFKELNITALPDDNIESLLSKVLILKDSNGGSLANAGYGIQFLILVTLSFLDKMRDIIQKRKDRAIFEDEHTKEKGISLVLGFDEPEIHLHPYMQRSLIKYLNNIINNHNPDFKILIEELFGIDRIIGQIIIVTQSPNIILNDYRQIIRFCIENDSVKIVSGTQLALDSQLKKHLYLNFPFIKEAFFSRCAIFVEGDSEYSSLPLFARNGSSPADFDDLGICIIQAHGDAVPQLITLAMLFGIPSVGITDKDNGTKMPVLLNHYQTNLKNFEEELVSIVDSGGESFLRKIIQQYDPHGIDSIVQYTALNKFAVDKFSIVSTKYSTNLKLSDIPSTDVMSLKAFYLTWFSLNKSYPLGIVIGETLTTKEIPQPYQLLIGEAVKLAKNV